MQGPPVKMILSVLLFLFADRLAVPGDEPAGKPSVATLSWLAGTWRYEKGERSVTEHWLPPEGGTMLGVSRTVSRGRTVEHEFIVIRENEAAEVVYVARPSGQAEATFRLVKASAIEAVFENPAHDFPQRIRYELKGDGTLWASIEGEKAGRTRRVEFPYRRVKP